MKLATMSSFGESYQEPYKCQFEWSEDCSCQCGDGGIVISSAGNYKTAFFEAFPNEISDYIRGEGKDIKEAEEDAWQKYRKIVDCPGHEYERRTHTNGTGYCKLCNVYKRDAFLPTTKCIVCQDFTNWTSDNKGNKYCKEHAKQIPEEDKKPWQKERDKMTSESMIELLFGK